MRWSEIRCKLDEYESKKDWPTIIGIGTGLLTGLVGANARSVWPIFVITIPGCIAALVAYVSLGVECPYCRRLMKYRGADRSEIVILRNMHQCPHCQGSFLTSRLLEKFFQVTTRFGIGPTAAFPPRAQQSIPGISASCPDADFKYYLGT